MFTKKFSTATAVGLAALLSASLASAADMTLNTKEINGRSSYIGVATSSGDLGDISFRETRGSESTEGRNGKKIKFDDPDGLLVTLGNDYGYARLETEFGYREADVASMTGVADASYTGVDGTAHIGTAMVNLAFEYSVDPGALSGGSSSGFTVTPFITAGGGALGVAGNLFYKRIDLTANQESIDAGFFLAPAIQGGAGITLGLPFGVEVFGKYSEMLAYTYNYKDSNDIHIKSLTGGLRVNF